MTEQYREALKRSLQKQLDGRWKGGIDIEDVVHIQISKRCDGKIVVTATPDPTGRHYSEQTSLDGFSRKSLGYLQAKRTIVFDDKRCGLKRLSRIIDNLPDDFFKRP